MNFCNQCGSTVSHKIPEGDTIARYVCDRCETIHYQNPRIIAGCIAEWQDRILLCKRAIEPRHGLWTLPAGFMENGETCVEGAARETHEEANAQLSDITLFCMFSIPHISQVYMIYRGQLVDGKAHPGSESLETALFNESSIPWDKLAFPVMTETLKLYFSDRCSGQFGVHNGEIVRNTDQAFRVNIY